jgi:uncharacterized protein (TIGR02594 family)
MAGERRFRVVARSLNVRAAPSTSADVIDGFARDVVVEWLETSSDGRFLRVRRGAVEGWCSEKYLERVPPDEAAEEFAWMPVARGELGVEEIRGSQHSPRIIEYLNSTNLDAGSASADETPWCSAFVNWCVEQAGYAGTDSAAARSWLQWGKALESPRKGCIVVLSRGGSAWTGHVGFFMGRGNETVQVLGGNQSDRVSVAEYGDSRVLGFREPWADGG